MVHQDLSHQAGGGAEKVSAIREVAAFLAYQPQKGFMHQCGGLEAVIRPLATQGAPGQTTQLFVDDRKQLAKCCLISLLPASQHPGDVFGGRGNDVRHNSFYRVFAEMRYTLAMHLLLLLVACNPEARVVREGTHFDPISGTTLTEESPSIGIVGLDGEEVCYTIDGGDPGLKDDCANKLDESRRIALTCGFHAVTIRWAEGEKGTEQASYLVDSPSCADVEGPVSLWQNDEQLRAFVAIKDALQCEMNGCENPGGTGNWSTTCGDGRVDWKVSLSGVRAISEFTYTNCRASTTVEIHDPADPYWLDETAVLSLDVELILNGGVRQDTDFSGNGDEEGTVTLTGDFTGKVESFISIANKARGGGWFESGCASGPVPGEICAPGEAMIRYDFPDWSCHGAICPEPGDPPVEGTDTDGDGFTDDVDVCPEVFDPYQLDTDADGIGDACDSAPAFFLIQFKSGSRCLYTSSGGSVASTSSCIATDPSQQWEIVDVGDMRMFKNVGTGACLSHNDSWIGPWTVNSAACNEADSFQQWNYEAYDQGGADASWPGRLHAVSDDFCAYTDGTGNVYGTIGNCDLAGTESGRKVGIFPYGDFAAAPVSP